MELDDGEREALLSRFDIKDMKLECESKNRARDLCLNEKCPSALVCMVEDCPSCEESKQHSKCYKRSIKGVLG